MKSIFKRILFTTCFILLFLNYCFASDDSIKITNEDVRYFYSSTVNGKVKLTISPTGLYNERMLLSYHIYDDNGELLVWEGERLPIKLVNNVGVVNYTINLENYVELKNYRELSIKFDIVDEKNVFWLSANENISFESSTIIYKDSYIGRVKEVWINAYNQSPIVLFINIISFVAFIIIGLIIRNKFFKQSVDNN